MKTLCRLIEYWKREEDGYSFSLPLICTNGKIQVREEGVLRCIPPSTVRKLLNNNLNHLLWVWEKWTNKGRKYR